MQEAEIKKLLDAKLSRERAKELLIELVKVPSPQTELLENEPLLKEFIKKAIEPRLRAMGFADVRYDAMGNLIASYGAGTSGKSLMFIGNAMNQPASTMPNPYNGDVVDGAKYDLPGECVMGKGASEQKANLAAYLHAMETVIGSGVPINGKLIFTCCLSGETGKHDAIKSVVEGAGVRADMAVLGGTGLKITLVNRGRIDVFGMVKGSPCHSARPWDGANAITGAMEAIRLLLSKTKLDKSHPQLGKQTLTVNYFQSFPNSTHTVQERVEFRLDRRLLPGEDPNEAFAELERIAKEVEQFKDPVSGKSFSVDMRLGPFMYPSLVTVDSPIVKALLRGSEVMLGKEVETYYSPSAFDQGYLNHVGIPTANFGAGEHQWAHTDYDMASVERTTDAARVYAFMMLDYLDLARAGRRLPTAGPDMATYRSLSVPTADIVAWTRAFVRHPSPQTERFEAEPQVQSFIAEQVVPRVQTLGLPWRRDPMGNLIVELGPERSDRSLMLMAYAMTHPASRMTDPYAGELIEGAGGSFVRGRGVSEQKGSLAAALAAVKTAADRSKLHGRLVFTVSTAGETGRHDAAISIDEALGFSPKIAIIVIGTTGRVALANKGRVDVIVTVRGKAAHSSTPWMGVNAIEGARRVLDRVLAVDVGGSRHAGLGEATLTPTAMRSWPEATHTVQDEVRLVFDRRLLPGDDPQAAFAAVAAAAGIGEPWDERRIRTLHVSRRDRARRHADARRERRLSSHGFPAAADLP